MGKAEEQLDIIYNVIEEAVKLSIPRKKEFKEEEESEDNIAKSTKNFIPKKVRQLLKKKQNLSEKILKYKNWHKNYKIQIELEQVEEELDGHYKERRQDEERKAIKKLYHDPSYFYKYQKKFSKTHGQLNGFLDKRGNVTKEPYEMSEMLREQYQSVANKPKKESAVEDGNYFFFFTSPSPFSYHFPSSPSTTNQEVIFPQDGECNDCKQGRVHLCQEDANLEQPYEGAGAASAQELRDLLAHHIERIEDERAANSSPGDQEAGHPTHPGASLQEETTREWMACDWADLSEAIDSIPAGASPGPDGIPAILLKKAKKPLSRMLCKLMKKTLETGEIPPRLKRSLIIPIHKGGSQGDPVNFRPISLTSHIMKTIERVIRRNIVIFLEAGNKLDPKQHGSRAQRSTLSQLLQHQDEILKALESGENIDCVYLDFAKAYDKVDHGILLHKLKALGISGHIGRWLMNFLTGRLQEVLVKGRKSQVFILVSGVPQGSVLGPILFLIFIGDISAGVVATILVYVDDSKVIKKVNSEEEVEELQEDLNQIYRWEKTNNMMFNGGKFLVVRYGANTELKENTLYFTSEMQDVIKQVNFCKDLGIIMQDNATFEMQIDKVCSKVRQKCGWLQRTFFNRTPRFMKHMFNTLVQPHIDYCSQLWAPAEGGELERLEGCLRTFTSKIPAVRHLPYWERLKHLKMNSEQRRLERYKIIYTWKVLEGLVPNCGLYEKETENERTGRKCQLPRLQGSARIKTMRESSFQISGPKLFNALPKTLRNLKNVTEIDFKEQLDQFLTKIPDEPKVSGSIPSCLTPMEARPTNSLMFWIPHLERTSQRRLGL